MATKIRLVGLDLDGTLLNRNGLVSEGNKKAILTCLEQGVMVYLITGRPYCFAKKIALEIDERIRVISSNGGLYEIGNRIVEHVINKEALHSIVQVIEETGMIAFFKGKSEFYTHEAYDKRFLYDHLNDMVPKELHVQSYVNLSWKDLLTQAHDIIKILVYHLNSDSLLRAREQIECIEDIEVTDYQSKSFDITANHVNKGIIIKKILEEYKITGDQFMAIGDGNNDIVMFQEAGLSIAMNNALDEVKQYCDDITDDVDEDGVASALYKYIRKED